jgi:hypothetical protein
MPQLLAASHQLIIHQRNFPFVQPLTRVAIHHPPPFPQPSLKPTHTHFSSHLQRRRGVPGTCIRKPKTLPLRGFGGGLRQKRAVATFPFSCTADPMSLTKSRSLDFGTTTIVECWTDGTTRCGGGKVEGYRLCSRGTALVLLLIKSLRVISSEIGIAQYSSVLEV